MLDDHQLLTAWRAHRSEEAFRALVERYSGLVHGVALRKLGQRPLAEEAAQNVFVTLARKAGKLRGTGGLAGWLHKTAVLEAAALRRRESRYQRRLKQIAPESASGTEPDPSSMAAPLLDDALQALPEADRRVLLLRFFEKQSFVDVATLLGLSHEAARKRGTRALERLAKILRRRGVDLSTMVLAEGLGQEMARAAPVDFVSAATAKALAASAAQPALSGLLAGLVSVKLIIATAFLAFLVPIGWQWRANVRLANSLVQKSDSDRVPRPLLATAPTPQVLAIDPTSTRNPALSKIAAEIAAIDRGPEDRLRFLRAKHLLMELPVEDLAAGLDLVRAMRKSEPALSLSEAIFRRWGELAPTQGLAVAKEPANVAWREEHARRLGLLRPPVLGLFETWVLADSPAAFQAAEAWDKEFALGDDRQKSMIPTMLASLANQRPVDAMRMAKGLADANLRDLCEIVIRQQWSVHDTEGAFRWVMDSTPDDKLPLELSQLMEQATTLQPKKALELALRVEDPNQRDSFIRDSFRQWAWQDPKGVREAVLSLPAELVTADLARELGHLIVGGDLLESAALVGKLPAGAQAEYAKTLAESWWDRDAESARAWMESTAYLPEATKERLRKDWAKHE